MGEELTRSEATLLFSGGSPRVNSAESADAAKQIREFVSRLLQVRNLSVLLGAGSSFHLGSPSIRGLDVEATRELVAQAGGELSDEQVRALSEVLPRVDGDLEAVLTTLTLGLGYAAGAERQSLWLGANELPIESVADLVRVLNASLVAACDLPRDAALEGEFVNDPFSAHRQFFRRLLSARRIDLPRVRLFTTNYDLVIEKALDEAGISYFDGFVGTVTRSFRPEVFYQDVYVPPGPDDRRLLKLPDVFYLHKLHGSLNWQSRPPPLGIGAEVVVQAPPASPPDTLALIYPTPQKEADVLGYPYSEQFRWLGYVTAQPESALVVLGYGFSDDHVNRLLFRALASNPTFHLLIVTPFDVVQDAEGEPPDVGIPGTSLAWGASIPARLSRLAHARMSVITGPLARFEVFPEAIMPDPGPAETTEEATIEALAEVLLRREETGSEQGVQDATTDDH